MHTLDTLKQHPVLKYFLEISQVPRPSKKEDLILAYLKEFAKKHQLKTKQDAIGNLLICKSASKGSEHLPGIILQSHVDMVCEKNSEVEHNFDSDPIQVYVDGDWLRAKNTTLGADCGIGMAAALAILAQPNLTHPYLECLFTVDEETGLTGANNIDPNLLSASTLINLDSEDDGELFIGCAGGIDTLAHFQYQSEPIQANSIAYICTVSGLLGGHSGDDINKWRGNAIKILNRVLLQIDAEISFQLLYFEGGNLRNAIAREATAILCFDKKDETAFKSILNTVEKLLLTEYLPTEPGFSLQAKLVTNTLAYAIDRLSKNKLLNSINACVDGVLRMSESIDGFVDTSSNLASIKMLADNQIHLSTSQRSASNSRCNNASSMVESVFNLAGATVVKSDGYPGWQPKQESAIVKRTIQVYFDLFGSKPAVKAIHAGLECGLFLEKYPNLDMVSFGPTIRGAHSPDERLELSTVDRFWELLLAVIKL